MEDLNFNNTGNEIKIYNRYTGKLNGNNHTISNIILTNEYLIGNLNGKFFKLIYTKFKNSNRARKQNWFNFIIRKNQ